MLRTTSVLMPTRIQLRLDTFGQQALEGFTNRSGGSTGAAVRTAALYYLSDDPARLARRMPSFTRAAVSQASVVEVDLDDDVWVALERAAAQEQVSTERLAEHSIMYFLADYESGKLAERLGEAIDEEA
jgi:hypothetical protein